MFIDKYYDNYSYYATQYPDEYRFVTTCAFNDAVRTANDARCPKWQYDILLDRIKTEFTEEDKVMEETNKKDFLANHPNADICIVNLALAIYGENSKKKIYDRIPLENSIDLAFELYKKKF